MREQCKILSPCGMLGYGFPSESFENGMRLEPDAIVVDAGSTDAGPHKLGAGVGIVSRMAAKKDLTAIITAGLSRSIPVIIGSAGGAGARQHVEWTMDVIREVLREGSLHAKIAVIYADIDKSAITEALSEGRITPLGRNVRPLTVDVLSDTISIVAQMGHEPIINALRQGADIIVCGRAYDPSPFAALGILGGFDPALCYHMGKILECGAICAEPGSGKDCILGTLYGDSFTVRSLNPARRCTKISVASHMFYEKDNPVLLHGPGFSLDLIDSVFTAEPGDIVRVSGSRYRADERYRIKLEGARRTCYRTFVIAAARDPVMIAQIKETQEQVKRLVGEYYSEIPPENYTLRFTNYGIDGVMGSREPCEFHGHEICVLLEALATTQELADAICATARSTMLHYGYPGRKSTAGNLAFPFAPSDVSFGPVYEFSVYHLMEIPDGLSYFPITLTEN